jgi:L-aspartate oxidase
MKKIHPLAELAPRDVVAYHIFREIQQSEKPCVFLSMKHLNAKKIKTRFKNIDLNLKSLGFDVTKDLLPVSPAAHYMIGGIRTNLDAETNVKGLFVCGEAASTGVMGANRLASNSLLECLVFGKRASEKSAILPWPLEDLPPINPVVLNPKSEQAFLDVQNEIATQMMKNLGIVRDKSGLSEALAAFEKTGKKYADCKNEYNLLKVKNSATLSRLIAKAALTREESRGGHIRTDYPDENPGFRVHTVQQKNKEIHFQPVRKEKQ